MTEINTTSRECTWAIANSVNGLVEIMSEHQDGLCLNQGRATNAYGHLIEDYWTSDCCVVVKVREMISELNADGWFQVRQSGRHRIFRRTEKKGSVAVPGALVIELSKSTLASLLRQAGLEPRSR